MYVLGLTGSIAMGKTTVARMFEDLGVPVFDADSAVHTIFADSRRVQKEIKKAFPKALKNGKIDRGALGDIVFSNVAKLHQLEMIVHPAVLRESRKFLKVNYKDETPLVVLDLPLLFEIRAEDLCDGVAVVSAPEKVQKRRLNQRAGMDAERAAMILARQMPDHEKQRRADFIIDTGGTKKQTRADVEKLVAKLRKKGH